MRLIGHPNRGKSNLMRLVFTAFQYLHFRVEWQSFDRTPPPRLISPHTHGFVFPDTGPTPPQGFPKMNRVIFAFWKLLKMSYFTIIRGKILIPAPIFCTLILRFSPRSFSILPPSFLEIHPVLCLKPLTNLLARGIYQHQFPNKQDIVY